VMDVVAPMRAAAVNTYNPRVNPWVVIIWLFLTSHLQAGLLLFYIDL